ncbi:MAG TPA: cytochrome c oxidase assembly protein [Solirubrobacteraceae bacterium]|nr:cytochrome c oxidase assembly protein [Solirubrobacteraceae bacterium]
MFVLAHLGHGTFAPLQLAPLTLTGILYALGVHRLAGTTRAVSGLRQTSFWSGLFLIFVALASPIGHVADELVWVHMIEHLLIGDIAPLLLVLGVTGPLLAPALRIRWIDRLRVLANPLVALPVWALSLYVWHVPFMYENAVRHEGVHALQHLCFVVFGTNMWMALVGPLPKPAWFGNFARLGYVLAVRLIGAVLGNVLVFGGRSFYHAVYAPGELFWHTSASGDQTAAGAIMMVEGSFVTIGLFCWLFLRAASEGEERQALMDLAGDRGVALTEARAARAVAAGRGADLRARIEGGPPEPPPGPA